MKYLGLDVGSKTIGIAVGQGVISLARTTVIFREYDFLSAKKQILDIIMQEKIEVVIVGHPLNMNGTKSKTTLMIEEFVALLQQDLTIKIVLWDERLTTRSVNELMLTANVSRKKRKINKDKLAAQLILQSYFDYLHRQDQA